MKTIAEILGGAQALLDINFDVQDCFEEYLTKEYKAFIHLLRVVEEFLPPLIRPKARTGRPGYPYLPFLRSMLAKDYFGTDKTSGLIQRLKGEPNLRLLCGFDSVPSEATFSRMLSYLADQNIWEHVLDALVKKAHKGKIVYHVSRDSTTIAAREKPLQKEKKPLEKSKKKRGRPPKGAIKTPKDPTVLEVQVTEDPSVSLEKLNKKCAWGCKKNSQGHIETTKGYKLNLDVSDLGFPLTAVITGANVHDSQLAIPMEKLTEQKVQFFYSLMDAGYDAKTIDEFIRTRGRIPIIDPNMRTDKNRPPLDPAKQERYKIRTTVERANSHLKDALLPKALYVKGTKKVSFVLMSAVVCLAALKYLQYFIC
jgi:transposase